MGRASLLTLTFGVFFFDYDMDGLPDIFVANGHIEEEISRVQPQVQYRSRRYSSTTWAAAGSRRWAKLPARISAGPSSPAARSTATTTATAISTSW